MEIITTNKSKSGASREQHIILIPEPPQYTLASYILLKEEYKLLEWEDSDEAKEWYEIIEYNIKFLEHVKRTTGELRCVYCQRIDLEINYDFRKPLSKKRRSEIATVDHVIPTSKGGPKFEYSNLVCSCSRCNSNKKDKLGYKIREGVYKY